MSNILAFPTAKRVSRSRCLAALLEAVVFDRRAEGDVFWLKECAEALSILAAMGQRLPEGALTCFAGFYQSAAERVQFYPQYYRFFLSMVLDLEDLGMAGNRGKALCRWAAQEGLAGAELSDLQRAEAQHLLARRGIARPVTQGVLAARLRAFAERTGTFAVPNRKAAYELTHIVYYLSDHGRRDPGLGPAVRRSLEYCGLVAFLDQNHDLLAEVCTAMRFAGMCPSPIWSQTVGSAHGAITPKRGQLAGQDGYHAFLVTGWAQAMAGGPCFEVEIPRGAVVFRDQPQRPGVLRPLSAMLFALGRSRRRDWGGMRGRVVPRLDGPSRRVLERAEQSSDQFEAFFSAFARALA